MDFDGTVGNDCAGIGIWVCSPFSAPNKVLSNVWPCSYKLAFDCSNNEAEYEALIAGLKILRKLNAKRIVVYGDSELVIKQVKAEYKAKHPRMRAYWNVVLDILKLFSDYTLTCVPRIQKNIAGAVAKVASNLNIPMKSSNKFEIHVSTIRLSRTIEDIGKFSKMMRRSMIFYKTKVNSKVPQLM